MVVTIGYFYLQSTNRYNGWVIAIQLIIGKQNVMMFLRQVDAAGCISSLKLNSKHEERKFSGREREREKDRDELKTCVACSMQIIVFLFCLMFGTCHGIVCIYYRMICENRLGLMRIFFLSEGDMSKIHKTFALLLLLLFSPCKIHIGRSVQIAVHGGIVGVPFAISVFSSIQPNSSHVMTF